MARGGLAFAWLAALVVPAKLLDLGARTAHGMRASLQALLVSTVLSVVKIVAGWLGHSYALIADGIESMLDIVSSLAVWGGLRIAAIPPDEDHPWGHGKAESLAAMFVALVLLGAAVALAIQSVREILAPQRSPAPFTLFVLVAVVVTKELLHRRLRRVGRRTDSTSLEGDAWHHRADALTSLAAFVGISVALIGGPSWVTADEWAALFACAIIAWNGARLLRRGVGEVMDKAAPPGLEAAIRETATGVVGVVAVEKCSARKSGPGWLVDLHVEVEGTRTITEGHAIAHRVKDALKRAPLGVLDVLVHIEPAPEPLPQEKTCS